MRVWVVAVVVLSAAVGCSSRHSRSAGSVGGKADTTRVHYQCDDAKTIDAVFVSGDHAPTGDPPRPTGHVTIALSDGRTLTLPQTLSADGVRFANADESFVFWLKGDGALVLEHNQEKSYIGCVRVAEDPGGLPQVFASGQDGFSLRYPARFTVDADHVYQALGPGHDIHGVAFRIDPALAQGTNLASDSYLAAELLPGDGDCNAGRFLDHAASDTTITDDGVTYTYAQAVGAGAGNRYEEHVFAIPGTRPCLAVRYFVHYGVLANYPEGTVRAFDHDALIARFDAMRRSLVIVR